MGASVGITVGVDGESEYTRSLKNITAETKAFQSEFKALQSSFSKNTSTWEKSQMSATVLTEQIDAQYRKLDALKTAQSKFAEGSTQWFDYADKINKATDALNKMEQQLQALPNYIQSIGEDFKTWGKNIEDAGKSISSTGDQLTRKVTTPIVGGLAMVVKETAEFDSAMSEVKSIAITTQQSLGRISAEEGEKSFQRLRDKAREIGRETVFSATEAANAMAYLARAGWTTEEILGGIDGVMALAAADGLDLATTASIVADNVTAFGKSADYASHLSDLLAMTSAQSNTNVQMLGDSFKYVAPMAAALDYEVEDVALALGLAANNGVKASQAGTGLRQALKSLISPTDKTAEAADAFGISLYDAEGKALPLMDVLRQLRATFGDLDVQVLDDNGDLKDAEQIMSEYGDSLPVTQQEKLQAIVDIFGTRAMPTMLAAINAGEDDFNKLSEAIYGAQGAAEKMSQTRLDNVGGDFTLLKDELIDLAIQLGDIIVPVLRNDVIPVVRDIVGWFSSLDEGTKEMIIKAGLFVAAVGPVLSVGGRLITGIGKLVGGVGNILTVVGGLGGVGAAVSSGIGGIVSAGGALVGSIGSVVGAIGSAIAAAGPVILAIAAVAAAVAGLAYLVYKHWDDIKAWTGELVEKISTHWENFKTNTKEKWNEAKEHISTAWDNIRTDTKEATEKIGESISRKWDDISTKTHYTWENVKKSVGDAVGEMKEKVSSAAQNIWEKLSGTFTDLVNNAKGWGSGIINALGEGVNAAWGWVESSVSGMGRFITDTLGGLARSAWSWGSDLVSNIGDGISSGISWVKEKASGVAKAISERLHFSTPDVGPLADADTYMPDFMKLLAGGIYKNLGLVERASDVLAAAIMPNTDGMITAGSGKSTTITNGDVVVNVYGAEGQDVRELARIVEQQITFNMNRRSATFA